MDIQININNVRGSQVAAKITGTFTVDGCRFKFQAIAFGRIGGHNVGVKLSKTVEKEIVKLGYTENEIINELQQRLVRGDVILPEGLQKDSFADS
jgi:hypothetical protein